MITSISQTNTEFFKLFHNKSIRLSGKVIPVPSRYSKKSAEDYVEESSQQKYPCIAIQEHSPSLKPEWFVDTKRYIGGLDSEELKVFLLSRPLWMEFVYDVSIVSKSYLEYTAMKDMFLRDFIADKSFLFNQKLTGEDAVGDVVPYTVRTTDIPRTDGVHECNYEFTLSVWVFAKEGEETDVATWIANLIQTDL